MKLELSESDLVMSGTDVTMFSLARIALAFAIISSVSLTISTEDDLGRGTGDNLQHGL